MSSDLTHKNRRDVNMDIVSYSVVRRTHRQLDRIRARAYVAQADITAAAEEAAAVVQARNAVAAAAAQADATLSAVLSALPISDASDADFRAQLKQATRASVIADTYRFQP